MQGDANKDLEDVRKGTMSTWKAAFAYQVPRSTLYGKFKGRNPVDATKGPNTYLTKDEEDIVF